MKKLLLLLILSLGLTSISNASHTLSKSSSSKELVPNTLKQIKVVKDWEPVADFNALKEFATTIPILLNLRKWNNQYGCINRIKNVNGEYTPSQNKFSQKQWFTCQMYIHGLVAYKPQILGDILLSWSTPNNDPMVCTTPQDPNYNGCGYHIPSALGTLAQSYSVWYDEINFTPKERERVDGYMTKKLMEQKYPILSHNTQPCDINNIHSIFEEGTDLDSCGHPRSKVAVGAIMLGFRLENQTLLDKGHDEIYLIHAFINENGIMLQEASRGAQSPNYYWDYSLYHSLLAGIYATVGYDYFEHILPHGAKPFEVLNFQYRLLKDFTLTAPWAHDDKTPGMYQYNTISGLTQEQYEKTYNAKNYYQFGKGDTQFIRAHTEFVKRYMPSIYVKNHKTFFNKKGPENWTNYPTANNANSGIHPYLLYIGNNSAEIKIDEALLQEKINHQLISELPIFEIKDGVLTLTLDKVDFAETEPPQKQKKNDNSELHKAEINGSLNLSSSKQIDLKTLVFQQATDKANRLSINVGDLTPPEMNPLKRHRDNLQKKCGMGLMNQYDWLSFISETSDIKNAKNQQCHYDYFKEASDEEAFELFQAVLAGTESILYYLQNSEKIVANQEQEKANNRATIQAEKTAKLKEELSIFKIDGETFNLALAKGDFIETGPFELERSEEYLQPFQLHKAFVQGSLRLNSNKKINFKTLVFKHADTKERKLVIHVGEMSIERHSDSLQKKCGPKVMEWGWLSFISKTNDIKSAKNQQCIYDYFKEANDKESLELFQAVLGGTDSILDYLQTNVEP